MNYSLNYRSYARPFRRPLTTAHGVWSVREGIIIELRSSAASRRPLDQDGLNRDASNSSGSEGTVGYGEIAPLSWFGSETQAEALKFCQSCSGTIADAAIDAIPDRFPACQFAFESARSALHLARSSHSPSRKPNEPLPICQLLPAGHASLAAIDTLVRDPKPLRDHTDRHTYKWKIGTTSIDHEFKIFQALLERLPAGSKLRLDANGGLSVEQAVRWLETGDRINQPSKPDKPTIEFIEQPLPPSQWHDLVRLSHTFATPIALDESIASLAQLRTAQTSGWRGIYVIKPAIIGSPQRLRSFCRECPIDTVFSSVFETAIGRDAGLQLAQELQTRDRAVGYGLEDWLMP
jgi:O-succinylbenzoate synthase